MTFNLTTKLSYGPSDASRAIISTDSALIDLSSSAVAVPSSHHSASSSLFQHDVSSIPAGLLDSFSNLVPLPSAGTQLLDASLLDASYLENVSPEQASAVVSDIVNNIITCGNCGGSNNVMETVGFLFSDSDKTSFFKALAEAIISRPALYQELLNRSAFVGEVRQAAELVSKVGTNNIEGVSIPPEIDSATIAADDVLPDWSSLPLSSLFDGDLADDDVSLVWLYF